ncbi:MAG: PEP-CTERM sorting domain-containing protein, partial [Akkermansiaceae bacterium]
PPHSSNQPSLDIFETINGVANTTIGYDVTNYQGTSTPYGYFDYVDISYDTSSSQFEFSISVTEANGEVDAFWFVFGETGNPRSNEHAIFYIDAYNDKSPVISIVPYDSGWSDASFAATWNDGGTTRARSLGNSMNSGSAISNVSATFGSTETYSFTLDASDINDASNWAGYGLSADWKGIQFDGDGVGVWLHAFETTGDMPYVNDPQVGWAIDPASEGNNTFPWPGVLTDSTPLTAYWDTSFLVQTEAVPEPSAVVLLSIACGGFLLRRRRG